MVRPRAKNVGKDRNGIEEDLRSYIADGRILSQYNAVSLKKIPARVLKYDVSLRDASLRAVQAMHTILTRMVLFHCSVHGAFSDFSSCVRTTSLHCCQDGSLEAWFEWLGRLQY